MNKDSSRLSIARLNDELNRLKQITGLGRQLELYWRPRDDSPRHGEVKGSIIFVYDSDEKEALRTMRHEFFDHLLCHEVIEPLVRQINMQKDLIESLVYERKELLLERFISLLDVQT